MRRKKEDITKKIAEELQIPEDAFSDTFSVELCGNSDVTVEGCNGIVEYGDTSVALNLGSKTACFCGTELEIVNFFERRVIIKGNILSVEFS